MGIHLRRFTIPERLSQNYHRKMKLSLALFLVIALVVLFYPEDSDANPGNLRRRAQLARAARARASRRPQKLGRRFRGQARRGGRTNVEAEAEAPPAPAEDDPEAAAKEGEEGAEEVPAWCDPTNPMGAWLNYKQIRAICGERGFEDFGPYGGIPVEEEAAEEGAEEVVEEVAEE